MKKLLFFALIALYTTPSRAQIINTIAGTGTAGYTGDGGPAVYAKIDGPNGIAVNASGTVYFADLHNQVIRSISPDGIITTVAGTGVDGYSGDGGPATNAMLSGATDLAIDKQGNVYVADHSNNRIRRITTDGIISTYAGSHLGGYAGDGGPATLARLFLPIGIALDTSGNLFIAELGNGTIRKVTTSGIISTLAGNGTSYPGPNNVPATATSIDGPTGITVDIFGNVYAVESHTYSVRKVDTSGFITRFAGTGISGFTGDIGPATAAELMGIVGLATDGFGNVLICDGGSDRIRQVNRAGIITTIAGGGTGGLGDGGLASNCELNQPIFCRYDTHGALYLSEFGDNRIRRISSVVAAPVASEPLTGIELYPNPCHGQCSINIHTQTDQDVQIRITSLTGQTISQHTITSNQTHSLSFSAPPGAYILTATTSFGGLYSKMISLSPNLVK